MRVPIGDISLCFDVDGCQLVPDGTAMVERPTIIALHGGPGADHSLFKPVSVLPEAGHGVFRETPEVSALLHTFLTQSS